MSYGTERQHNYNSISSISSNNSQVLDNKSYEQYMSYNLNLWGYNKQFSSPNMPTQVSVNATTPTPLNYPLISYISSLLYNSNSSSYLTTLPLTENVSSESSPKNSDNSLRYPFLKNFKNKSLLDKA
jgi:hypothetical protein